jgi:hypothetical protein
MLAYARLSPGAGFRPARALAYYAQRLVTHPGLRGGVSQLIAAGVRLRRGRGGWPLDERATDALKTLRTDGVSRLAPLMTPAEAARMRAYFEGHPVVARDGSLTSIDRLPRGTPAAGYALETVLACPGVLDLINRPEALGLSEAYLGCKPTVSSVGVRWTFAIPESPARFQVFHRDMDDWRFVKLFVYLTDVDEACGPHVYVRGSHRTAFSLTAEAYSIDGLEGRYGPDALETVTGPAGTSFVADTLGVHRGGFPRARPRLMLQVQYSLLPVFAFLYGPATRRATGLDPYCNRLFVRPGEIAPAN